MVSWESDISCLHLQGTASKKFSGISWFASHGGPKYSMVRRLGKALERPPTGSSRPLQRMLDTWVRAIVLGALQGVTEFLPISSSAHLLILPWFFGWEPGGLTFDIFLHGGTLLALLVYFRGPLAALSSAILFPASRPSPWDHLLLPLLTGTLPIIVFGVLFLVLDIGQFRTPQVTAFNLALFGILLWIADRVGTKTGPIWSLSPTQGFLIGVAQALALMPGVSRSGVTITVALLLGLSRPEAARFSFLLGIPAITLATGGKVLGVLANGTGQIPFWNIEYLSGIVAAFVVGLFSIRVLLRLLETRTMTGFVAYRLLLSAVLMAWLWTQS